MTLGSLIECDLEYEYSQLGNRLEKSDSVTQRQTCYVYDTD